MEESASKITDYYSRHDKIGQGVYAIVYDCTRNGERACVKSMYHDMGTAQKFPAERGIGTPSLREIQIASTLQSCPRVARAHSAWVRRAPSCPQAAIPEICMERCGACLFELAKKPLSHPQLRACAFGALEALEALHARRIAHRDVKASNLLVHQEGRVVISDFGISKQDPCSFFRGGEIPATPYVQSRWVRDPEIVLFRDGSRAGPAADLWALG